MSNKRRNPDSILVKESAATCSGAVNGCWNFSVNAVNKI